MVKTTSVANAKIHVHNDPNISLCTVHKVLHEKLGIRKFYARLVCYVLTPEQKTIRVLVPDKC